MKTEPNEFINPCKIDRPIYNPDDPEDIDMGFTVEDTQHGLTKREHFMSMAIQGLCANTNYSLNEIKQGGCVDIAEAALYIVDATINALNDNP